MPDERPPEVPEPDDEGSDQSGQIPPLGGGSAKPGSPPPLGGSGGAPGGQFPPLGGAGFVFPGQPPLGGAGGSGQDNSFAALFGQFGQHGPGGGDMNALVEQLQSAFAMLGGPAAMFGGAPASGSGVNWDVTKDTARKTVASLGPDPSPTSAQQREVAEAVSLAEVWLDQATSFPQVSTQVSAWSRAEWIENTMAVWQRLVEPVATHIADAMENALTFGEGEGDAAGLPGLAGMEQMLRPMLRSSGASMFGLQLGQGLGQLATEVVGATDVGLPLSEAGHVALLPTNVQAFGAGLDQSASDVRLYLALRECARQRLFAAAGWLREQMLALVEQYARGITIDTSALEDAVSQLDPSNLAELSEKLEGGLFEPHKSPEQLATLERLETMLALVEGWVDEVVTQATGSLMPTASALAETVRRSRATGGPAEATFATLVGLELRPRRMRDAANLWAALRDARGVEGRDAVWTHPDLLPTAAHLDDPLGYVAGDTKAAESADEFDAALAELLDSAAGEDSSTSAQQDPNDRPSDDGQPPRDA